MQRKIEKDSREGSAGGRRVPKRREQPDQIHPRNKLRRGGKEKERKR